MSLALVTGAARRLGRAMALALAEDGLDVAIHCHGSGDDAEALDSLAGAHPVDAMALAPVLQALQTGLGSDYPAFAERISELGSGDLTATGYLGEACLKFTCEADWALLYLHRETQQVFAIWHVYGEIENRIHPQDTTLWPPEAMALLRERAGP